MLPFLLVALSIAWSTFVVAVVAGSARFGGRTISLFDHRLLTPGEPLGVWILTAFSATAGVALACSIASARARRLRRRMAAEFDARWDELSRRNLGLQARQEMLRRRVSELRSHVGELTDRRNALLEEVGGSDAVGLSDGDGHRSVVDLAARRTKRRFR
jgi:hypothetical protein